MPLSRDEILSASDLNVEEVDVPEWGGSVLVRTMTGAERDRMESEFLAERTTNVRARLAAVVLCDEAGRRLFSDQDIALLGAKSGAALDRVFAVAMHLNGMTKRDVDELEKNSEAILSDGSVSDSLPRCL